MASPCEVIPPRAAAAVASASVPSAVPLPTFRRRSAFSGFVPVSCPVIERDDLLLSSPVRPFAGVRAGYYGLG